jgi:hypothetical protein
MEVFPCNNQRKNVLSDIWVGEKKVAADIG